MFMMSNSVSGEGLKGLNVEIQYRTAIQHAWATVVEILGVITDTQPKFQKGDIRFTEAMSFASEILARAHERHTGPYPHIDNHELVKSFLAIDKELGLIDMLRGLNNAANEHSENKNFILDNSLEGKLEITTFRNGTEALRHLFKLEQERPFHDIVLVRADSTEDVRYAFRNYFQDAKDFIRLLESGCAKLVKSNRKNT